METEENLLRVQDIVFRDVEPGKVSSHSLFLSLKLQQLKQAQKFIGLFEKRKDRERFERTDRFHDSRKQEVSDRTGDDSSFEARR